MIFERQSKNKKVLLSIIVVFLIGGISYIAWSTLFGETNERKEVQNLVETFGKRLQNVSLIAPRETLTKSMEENYGELVSSPILIAEWVASAIEDPVSAPGRLTSSPWPDRIEITSIERLSEFVYQVKGEVIEITSDEGVATKRPITILVEQRRDLGNRWLISSVTLGSVENNQALEILSWYKIKQAIYNCEVKQVFQAHSRDVTAKLKNGTKLSAIEPNLDDIIKIAVESAEKCGRIIMATE